MKHFKYLRYLVRHIWYVRKACWRNGLFWQGLLHDLSKWRPDEWIPYVEFFYGKRAKKVRDDTGYYKAAETGDAAFDYAWLLHQKRNRHHWQFWILPLDDGGTKLLPMPPRYRLEMLCDWWGASMAQGYGGKCVLWYAKNKDKMQLHPETRLWVDMAIEEFEDRMSLTHFGVTPGLRSITK